jgi:DNA-binding NtrC family response regulator
MKEAAILIVGDDLPVCRALAGALRFQGKTVIQTGTQPEVRRLLRTHNPEVVIIGAITDEVNSELCVAEDLRRRHPTIPIILLVPRSTEALAIAAVKINVQDYFKAPFGIDEIVAGVNRRLSGQNGGGSMNTPPGRNSEQPAFDQDRLVGCSRSIILAKNCISQVAAADSTVLITGETGTGKELVAQLIHQLSPRHQKPLVCVNCAALPDTLLESELYGYERGAFTGAAAATSGKMVQARSGSIFFDEIGDLSLHAQTAILRAIETKEITPLGGRKAIQVDARVIAATNQNLERMVSENTFRKDLFYRLNVARIQLEPLRERKEDIPLLLDHYVREFNLRFSRRFEGFTSQAVDLLLQHDWPGNVRELKNTVEVSFIGAPSRASSRLSLPESLQSALIAGQTLPEGERERLIAALHATNWNISKAAGQLHWSRMTLYRKMAKYHFTRSDPGRLPL